MTAILCGVSVAFASAMGGVNSKSTDEASPSLNDQVLDVVYRDERDELHNVKDLGHIRRSALFFSKVDFPAQVLRSRLNRSLHRIRLADGTRLGAVLTFDAQTVSEPRELLAAIWMVEEQKWDEVAEVLQWASECGFCQLPLNLTADDINTHANKTVRHTHRGAGREQRGLILSFCLSVCCGVGV